MKMYAKIIDSKNRTCNVAVGTDADFYESIGMTLMDVEKGFDGQWYVEGFAPAQDVEQLKQDKLTELTAVHAKWRDDEAYFVSSLGFKADGKTATINDISLLWDMADLVGEGYVCTFVDYDNQPHMLSYEQVKQLYIEAGQARQQGYSEKWLLRNMIESAETADDVAHVELKFTPVDFTKSE